MTVAEPLGMVEMSTESTCFFLSADVQRGWGEVLMTRSQLSVRSASFTNAASDVDPARSLECQDALEFGEMIDGCPELLVYVGLFPPEGFRFNPPRREYVAVPSESLASLQLEECNNLRSSFESMAVEGFTANDFIAHGFGTLAYLAGLSRARWLADFFDNPGLLAVLLAAGWPVEDRALLKRPRKVLLAHALGVPRCTDSQIAMLARVRAPELTPTALTRLLKSSILWETNSAIRLPADGRRRTFLKLLRHQRRWSADGMELVSRLLRDDEPEPGRFVKTLDALNAPGRSGYRNAYQQAVGEVCAASKAEPFAWLFPSQLYAKLEQFAKRPSDDRKQRLETMMRALSAVKGPEIYTLVLREAMEDSDIAAPLLRPSVDIRHLNTCRALAEHAKRQGNCIWNGDMIAGYLSESWDIYEYRGMSTVSISVNRKTRLIEQIQAAEDTGISPEDMLRILSWFKTALDNVPDDASAEWIHLR